MTAPLRLTVDDAVARVTLTRPAAANTVNLELARALERAARALSETLVRVVVIDAEGPQFCGGGDVREVASASDPATALTDLATAFHRSLDALTSLDAVIIAAVDGAVAGGGLGLVLATDVAIASENARFLTAYEKIGVTPDSGVSVLLPRAIGERRALEFALTGRELDAATALEWGLVAQVVPSSELPTTVDVLARRLAKSPVSHLVRTRRLLRTAPASFAYRLAEEAHAIGEAASTPYAADRISRFAPRPSHKEPS